MVLFSTFIAPYINTAKVSCKFNKARRKECKWKFKSFVHVQARLPHLHLCGQENEGGLIKGRKMQRFRVLWRMRVQWASVLLDNGPSSGRGIAPLPSSSIKLTFIIRHFTPLLIEIFSVIRFSQSADWCETQNCIHHHWPRFGFLLLHTNSLLFPSPF